MAHLPNGPTRRWRRVVKKQAEEASGRGIADAEPDDGRGRALYKNASCRTLESFEAMTCPSRRAQSRPPQLRAGRVQDFSAEGRRPCSGRSGWDGRGIRSVRADRGTRDEGVGGDRLGVRVPTRRGTPQVLRGEVRRCSGVRLGRQAGPGSARVVRRFGSRIGLPSQAISTLIGAHGDGGQALRPRLPRGARDRRDPAGPAFRSPSPRRAAR